MRGKLWVLLAGSVVLQTVTGCSSGGAEADRAPAKPPRPPGIHHWTGDLCDILGKTPLAEGFRVSSSFPVGRSDAIEDKDVGQEGSHPLYQYTGCQGDLKDEAHGDYWKMIVDANVYEDVGPACANLRATWDMRATAPVAEVRDQSHYSGPYDNEESRAPGRRTVTCDGNLLVTAVVYAAAGTRHADVDTRLNAMAAHASTMVEKALRDRDAEPADGATAGSDTGGGGTS